MPYEHISATSPEATSGDMISENVKALAKLFPSVVQDGHIDVEALKQLIGDNIAKGEERFGLNWHGKREARRAALTPSLGTLRPCKEDSVEWDTTKNLYIEGDNLEVLKLLRKSYSGKVKMIYIDPPYNTGNEFVYRDDYQNSIDNYKKLTGQEGVFAVNAESSGRFHTDWLMMMYPRLIIARDLLADNGYICISIDDNEVCNAQEMCNEVFGENNHISNFIVIRSEGGGLAKRAVIGHDYLLVYAKNIDCAIPLGRPKDIRGQIVTKDGEEYWIETDWLREEFGRYGTCHYEDITRWYNEEKKKEIDEGLEKGLYVLLPKNEKHIVGRYRKVAEDTSKFYTVVKHLNKNGVKDLEKIGLDRIFDYPKPVSLVKEFVLGATILSKQHNDIILDFFSGSATTAHAVMKLNAEDGGNRRFIMVQLPEPCRAGSVAANAGFKNICEIGKERIRRVGREEKKDADLLDAGFRVYKLDSSNVKAWNPQSEDLVDAMNTYAEHLVAGRTNEDFLTEIMLKSGIDLVEDVDMKEIAGHKVYSLGLGQYYACMDADIAAQSEELALGIAQWHEEECTLSGGEQQDTCTVFVLDMAFIDHDDDKMNFISILEQHGISNIKAL